jgi:hypothetical protein
VVAEGLKCTPAITRRILESLITSGDSPHPTTVAGIGDEFNYIGRKEKRPGPYGKLTLGAALWPPHSIAAQCNVKEGDFVELRNVKMKLEAGRLEGVLHTDRKYPDRVNVRVLNTKYIISASRSLPLHSTSLMSSSRVSVLGRLFSCRAYAEAAISRSKRIRSLEVLLRLLLGEWMR